MFLSLSLFFSLSFTSFYLLLFTSFYHFFIGFIFSFHPSFFFFLILFFWCSKSQKKIIFISEIACSIVINCLLMVPFLCLSFTLSAVWWVDPSHSLCLLIHLCYIIYYDLTVSCAASIDSHFLVLLSQTLIPHPCLIKLSIKQELFSWSFYNILCCPPPPGICKNVQIYSNGGLKFINKNNQKLFLLFSEWKKNSFPLTLFLYQFSSIYFNLFQRNISLLSTALLKNRKRMMLKWEQRERKYRRKEEREGERDWAKEGDRERDMEERRDGRWEREMCFRGLVTIPCWYIMHYIA